MDERSTKEKIMTAAIAEFADRGLAGARVDRIARAAGANKAMLYYYFGSKEELYRHVLDSHLGQLAMEADHIVGEADTVEKALEQIARLYVTLFSEHQELRPLILRELAEGGDQLGASFRAAFQLRGLPRKLKRLLDRGKREGRYRNVDSRQALISFLGMNLQYLIAAPMVNSIWEIKDAKRFREARPKHVVDLFLHGLLAR